MDPIKPKHRLTKKPNFKKEKLEGGPVFISPGVYTREVDTSSIDYNRNIWVPLNNEEPNGNGRIYSINVGELNDNDVQHFIDRMRTSMMIPQQYFGNQETEVGNLYGELSHPVGISSRSRQRPDGEMELLGYDLVASPSTPSAVLGGEQMMYEASTWMTLHKKKSRWGRFKVWVSNIYKKWKRAE